MKKIIALCLFSIVACKNESQEVKNEEKTETENVYNKTDNDSVVLDFFNGLPPETDGCMETCTYDTNTPADSAKVIYASNLQYLAFIKVSGTIIRMQKDTLNSKMVNSKEGTDVYTGNEYRSILKYYITKDNEDTTETFEFKGNLQILKNDSIRLNIKVKGFGGC